MLASLGAAGAAAAPAFSTEKAFKSSKVVLVLCIDPDRPAYYHVLCVGLSTRILARYPSSWT